MAFPRSLVFASAVTICTTLAFLSIKLDRFQLSQFSNWSVRRSAPYLNIWCQLSLVVCQRHLTTQLVFLLQALCARYYHHATSCDIPFSEIVLMRLTRCVNHADRIRFYQSEIRVIDHMCFLAQARVLNQIRSLLRKFGFNAALAVLAHSRTCNNASSLVFI